MSHINPDGSQRSSKQQLAQLSPIEAPLPSAPPMPFPVPLPVPEPSHAFSMTIPIAQPVHTMAAPAQSSHVSQNIFYDAESRSGVVMDTVTDTVTDTATDTATIPSPSLFNQPTVTPTLDNINRISVDSNQEHDNWCLSRESKDRKARTFRCVLIVIITTLVAVLTGIVVPSLLESSKAPPTAPPTIFVARTYKVIVHTGASLTAGTDSNVDLSLIGSKGDISVRLNPLISGNAFEKGNYDTIYLRNYADIGTMHQLKICTDGSWLYSDWLLDYVEIDGHRVEFNAWIDGDCVTRPIIQIPSMAPSMTPSENSN